MTDHYWQRVAFLVIIPTENDGQRQEGQETIEDITSVQQCRNEAMLQGIEECRHKDGYVSVLYLVGSTTEVQTVFRKGRGYWQ